VFASSVLSSVFTRPDTVAAVVVVTVTNLNQYLPTWTIMEMCHIRSVLQRLGAMNTELLVDRHRQTPEPTSAVCVRVRVDIDTAATVSGKEKDFKNGGAQTCPQASQTSLTSCWVITTLAPCDKSCQLNSHKK
jgi:hypothetical protein